MSRREILCRLLLLCPLLGLGRGAHQCLIRHRVACEPGGTQSTQQTVCASLQQQQAAQGGSQQRARKEGLPSVLIRLVDDFLFISPSRAAAEAVACRLLQGAPACAAPCLTSMLLRPPCISRSREGSQRCMPAHQALMQRAACRCKCMQRI
jgi:hypothetical protein